MLNLRMVADRMDEIRQRLSLRGEIAGLDRLEALAGRRRTLIHQLESLRHEQKQASLRMKQLAKGDSDATDATAALRKELKAGSARQKQLDAELKSTLAELENLLLEIPNLPHESVAPGQSEADNPLERTRGHPPQFDFEPAPHWDIGQRLGLMDFSRGAKLSGSRFTVLTGKGARLERALINFMLDLHAEEHGYTEVWTPFLVLREIMVGTGQLPKFEDEAFKTADPELFLIPTAEVPVTNLHRDEILDAERLPLRYVCYTPCFRREAGAAGRDTRGLIRQHQFNKVELVKLAKPEQSYAELESLTADAEEVLNRLGLHYRVVSLCGGDLGFSAAKTYDLEIWMPAQRVFREISSCSNFEDFQARRAKIRYRQAKGEKPQLLHTLNGSGLAVGRTLACLLETGQRQDGSVLLPEVLEPYTGFRLIEPA